ncbi:hypothetical protein QIS74_02474 [Colletotrichum tabaci]|uniref:Archaemetzincin-2 n=1 Tax=Colletotrichum tabaci TaxID=1209068 RepID=A0AAV9TV25_9PEZI
MAPRGRPKTCPHDSLLVDTSEYGRKKAGFVRIPAEQRAAAMRSSGRATANSASDDRSTPDPATFPGPLVLPDDDLALDPRAAPQSLRSWTSGHWRNPITPARKTMYVAGVPAIDNGAAFMRGWDLPDLSDVKPPAVSSSSSSSSSALGHPKIDDIVGYFSAFYHPLPAKPLPAPLTFVRWDGKGGEVPTAGAKLQRMMVGLATGDGSVVGIRARPAPDGLARMQLNLCDLLDALLSVLPGDAYAACLVVAQDLYEDDDDDFCCGRAFGGSRICVVSSFRYRPALDGLHGVEREHMWPASHCERFVVEAVEWWEEQDAAEAGGSVDVASGGQGKKTKSKKGTTRKKKTKTKKEDEDEDEDDDEGEITVDLKRVTGTAMGAAVQASRDVLVPRTDTRRQEAEDLRGLWFGRVARTAAHEVGHCLGMGHCVYFACVMQGTGGLGEDGRQPPYLCPVCEAKFVWGLGEKGVVEGGAVGRWRPGRREEVEKERMEVVRGFCEAWRGVGMFAAYGAWLDARLRGEEFGPPEVEVIDLTGE